MSKNELSNWTKIPKWLKWFTLYVLPAIGTLYGTLATIWSLPFGEQVLASCMAVQLALGTSLGITIKKEK